MSGASLEALLHENMLLISCVHECRANGMHEQAAQYQQRLHRNLLAVSQHMEAARTRAARDAVAPRPWTSAEDAALSQAVRAHGGADVAKVAAAMGTGRSEAEVAARLTQAAPQ